MNTKKNTTYILAVSLTLYGIYSIFKKHDLHEILTQLKKCHLHYVGLAIVAHLLNHGLRAYRWKKLLETQREKVAIDQAYYAEMSGFFINSIFLRVGDLARCNALRKIQGAPIHRSLGTVIVERCTDFVFFCVFLTCAVVLYFQVLKQALSILSKDLHAGLQTIVTAMQSQGWMQWGVLLMGALTVCYALYLLFRLFKAEFSTFFKKLTHAIKASLNLTSVGFWMTTTLILVFYFLLEYFCFFAFDETAQAIKTHGLAPVIAIFIALQASHMIPSVAQGAGIYHLFISNTLACFGVGKEAAMAYAIITHGIQLFNGLIPGGLCFLKVLLTKNHLEKKSNV